MPLRLSPRSQLWLTLGCAAALPLAHGATKRAALPLAQGATQRASLEHPGTRAPHLAMVSRLRGGFDTPINFHEDMKLSLQLAHAAGLGALLGMERGWAGRPAGYRTMSLVCMGAALFTGVGKLTYADGARIAAQVVTGVGFIGAGVVKSRSVEEREKASYGTGDYLKGLTTASAIWIAAGVGIACGSDHGVAATMATLLSLVILGSYRLAYGNDAAERDMWDMPR